MTTTLFTQSILCILQCPHHVWVFYGGLEAGLLRSFTGRARRKQRGDADVLVWIL
jgi:hypothetical protein